MKNYSLNKVMLKNFILNYIVLNKDIFINYADGNVKCISYSVENEKAILNKMKQQVLGAKRFSSSLNRKFEIFLKLFIDEILLLVLFIMANFSIPIIPLIGGISVFSSLMGFTLYKLISYKKIKDDIKKHMLFIRNEDSLNLTIRNNQTVIMGLDEKLKKKVLVKETKNFSFTINTIDKMKYRELKQVYSCVEQVISGNRPKSLVRRRKVKKTKKFE